MLCFGVVIGAISLLAFLAVPYQVLCQEGLPVTIANLEKILQLEGVLSRAQTHAFTVLGMSQLVHAVGMRDVNCFVFRMKHLDNPYMLLALSLGMALQLLVTEIPYFVELFGTRRLSLAEWGRLGLLCLMPLALHELLVLSGFLGERQEAQGEALKQAEKGQDKENEAAQKREAAREP